MKMVVRRLVRSGIGLLAGVSMMLPMTSQAGMGHTYPLLIIGDGGFSFFTSSCNPTYRGFSFPVRLVSGNVETVGTASVQTCFRANPGGDPTRLVNESDTQFVFQDGSTLTVRVTTYGTAVPAPTPDHPGNVNLILRGSGRVVSQHGLDTQVGADVRQDGVVLEQDCFVETCPGGLGAGFLPLEAVGLTFLVGTN